MKRLDVPDGHLTYRDEGTGRPIVLLHGGSLDHRMWDQQVDDLARDHRVVVPDARGHGRSSTPVGPFRHGDDVAALLRETGPATLVGLSMGAGTAIDTALEHPDLVDALIFCCAGTSEAHWEDPWILDILATWQRTQAAGDLAGWIEAFMRVTGGPYRSLDDVDPDVVARCRTMVTETMTTHIRTDPTTGQAVPPEVIPVERTWERLPQIAVPVLAVLGALDAPDHNAMAARVANEVQDGEAVTVDGTAHYPTMERPQEFLAVLRTFLARTTRRPPAAHAAGSGPGAGRPAPLPATSP